MKHSSCTLHVIKPNQFHQTQSTTGNIFQTNLKCFLTPFNPNSDKPVGGMIMFMKEHKKRQHRLSNSRQFIGGTQRKIQVKTPQSQHDTQNKSIKQDKTERQRLGMPQVNQHQQKYHGQHDHIKQQQYKTHQQFRPKTAVSTSTRPMSGIFKNTKIYQKNQSNHKNNSVSHNQNKFRKSLIGSVQSDQLRKSQQWAKSQIQSYNQKYAMLGELAYNQPLQKKYGERYFQYSLRDRYKDELKSGPYVYQIKQSNQQLMKQKHAQSSHVDVMIDSKAFKDTKSKLNAGPGDTCSKMNARFLTTLRKFRPQVGKKQRLILRGSSLKGTNDQQDF